MIFSNDHEPKDVHVFGQGGEAKINLIGAGGVTANRVVGIGKADLRRIIAETQDHREALIAAWERVHG